MDEKSKGHGKKYIVIFEKKREKKEIAYKELINKLKYIIRTG